MCNLVNIIHIYNIKFIMNVKLKPLNAVFLHYKILFNKKIKKIKQKLILFKKHI